MVVLMINVDLAIFQPYLDLEAGDNQSLKIQVARPGIILGNWYLILSFDLLREKKKIFTTIDLFSIIHKCIKIRFQNCN